MISQAKRKNY